jgi:hypothetical protein
MNILYSYYDGVKTFKTLGMDARRPTATFGVGSASISGPRPRRAIESYAPAGVKRRPYGFSKTDRIGTLLHAFPTCEGPGGLLLRAGPALASHGQACGEGDSDERAEGRR